MVGNVTFLSFLQFSMSYSLHVAINVCINWSFFYIFIYTAYTLSLCRLF